MIGTTFAKETAMAQVGWTAALMGALALLAAGGVAAQPAPSPPSQVPAADPAFEAAKAAFEGLPEVERKAVQDALVWTGDYNSVVTGTFGRRTFEALTAYQRRAKLNPTGVLDGKARADLQAAAQRAREAVKFAVVTDPKTGARIGVPERLLPKRDLNPNGGRAGKAPTVRSRSIRAPSRPAKPIWPRFTSATSRSRRRAGRSRTRFCGPISSSSRARRRPASSTSATPAAPRGCAASRSATTRP
jgi:Putative peptidoglycan binding domain